MTIDASNDSTFEDGMKAGLVQAAKLLDVSKDTIRLHTGEMSAQEMRSVRAVLRWKKAEIERLIMPPRENKTVTVPSPDFRVDDPKAQFLWYSLRITIDQARAEFGNDMAFSIILSRVSRELRRCVGIEDAAEIFHGLAATQAEAAQADVTD